MVPALIVIIAAATSKERSVPKTKLDLLWKVSIGRTTHRTNVDLHNGQLVIGSNGSHFNDYLLEDNNGIYFLDPGSGKVKVFRGGQQYGDLDVNGVVAVGDDIIFGNDNDEIIRMNAEGKSVWRIPFSGDVEHAPVDLTIDGKKALVFAGENGEVRAIDPENGKTIWKHYHPDFDGWKEGNDRTYFKIRMHFSASNIFFNRPALADLDNDGTTDLLYNCEYETLYAVSGQTGKLLWKTTPSGQYGKLYNGRESPAIFTDARKIGFLRYNHEQSKYYFSVISYKGVIEKSKEIVDAQYGALSHSENAYHMLDRTIRLRNGEIVETRHKMTSPDEVYAAYTHVQIAQETVRMNNEECFISLYQYNGNHSGSTLAIIGKETGKLHYKDYFSYYSEFTPVIRDLDNDGKLDILIGSQEGILYAYGLKIAKSNLVTN
jgi:outer membrane protein assembly factor BamB